MNTISPMHSTNGRGGHELWCTEKLLERGPLSPRGYARLVRRRAAEPRGGDAAVPPGSRRACGAFEDHVGARPPAPAHDRPPGDRPPGAPGGLRTGLRPRAKL